MPRFDACLFDYGNTLVEFDRVQTDVILVRLVDVLSSRIAPVELAVLEETIVSAHLLPHEGDPPTFEEMSPEAQMAWVLERIYGETAREDIEHANEALQDLFVGSIAIDSEVVDLLGRLRRRCRLGLVSNYPCGKTIRRSLEKEGISELLDPVVVSGDVGFVKPHPRPFEVALAALGVEPGRILFAGDRWDMDMVGARKLGMKTCHITGYTSESDWETRYAVYRPDYVVGSPLEMEGLLER